MENPEVTILQSQVISLQMVVSQMAQMLKSNFPNGGFGDDLQSNAMASISMNSLMLQGKGPNAYLRWLQDPSFKPRAFLDYPEAFTNQDSKKRYELLREVRNTMYNQIGHHSEPALASTRLFWDGEALPDGFYHQQRYGGDNPVSRSEQGVLFSVRSSQKTQVYIPFDQNTNVMVFVYVYCEQRWAIGEWCHVDMEIFEREVNDFLNGTGDYAIQRRPPAVPVSALIDLFNDPDLPLDHWIEEPTVVSSLPSPPKPVAGVKWTYSLLDPLPYVADHTLAKIRYVGWHSGMRSVWIRLDDEQTVKVFTSSNQYHRDNERIDWNDYDNTSQWRLFDWIRKNWVEHLSTKEKAVDVQAE